jgi:uncharacterized protein YkwD
MKKSLISTLNIFILFLTLSLLPNLNGVAAGSGLISNSNAYDVIDAVNGLRSSRGLSAYKINSILMQIAQSQADYLASTNGANGHIGPGGTHPFDRAIAAGYPVSGGFISENWVTGSNLDAQGAINFWMGDAPHQLTMLSPDLQDIGAGVASDGNLNYFVIDCGLARGSVPEVTLPGGVSVTTESGTPSGQEAIIAVAIVSTPDEKGSVYHIVQPGQSLWQIAIAYKTTVDKIQNLNNLTSTNIFAGQKLFISYIETTTTVTPTSTETGIPASSTPLPTIVVYAATPEIIQTQVRPESPVQPSAVGPSVISIIFVSLLLAGLVAWIGRSRSI